MKIKLILFVLIISTFAVGCKKRIVERQAVIDIIDISITDGGDLKYFSFPSIDTGFVAANKNFIYKTVNAGASWTKIYPIGSTSTSKCKGIEFFDEMHGMVLMERTIYVTADGGVTWIQKIAADDICQTKGGIGVAVIDNYVYGTVKKTTNKGVSFFSVGGNVDFVGGYISARATGDFVFVFGTSNSSVTNGLNLINNQATYFCYSSAYPSDVYIDNNIQCSVGKSGLVQAYRGYNCHDRVYDQHSLDYNSVDGYDGIVVAVGNNTMVSNKILTEKDEWTEVFNSDGNGFHKTFYRIRFINQNTFIVSGNNGLLWRATI